MYEKAIINKYKPEFNWQTNSACIDFHLIINGGDNFYYSGSYCDGSFEFYREFNMEQQDLTYVYTEFMKKSIRTIKRFLDRKNKKEYEIDMPIEVLRFKLWNNDSQDYDEVKMSTFLTYCP